MNRIRIEDADRETLIDIISFLLDLIEEEHMGARRYAIEEIEKEWELEI